jgi:glycosyltransferase involved in cell wall biosynthesis
MGIESDRICTLTTMFDPSAFAGVTRSKQPDGVTLIFLGRLIKEKGIYELLEGFRAIADEFARTRLVIAGDGPEKTPIESWIRSNGCDGSVIVAGYLHAKKKIQALIDADVFVLPTYWEEGCPIALLEAMAAGLAVVTTANGGIRDIFVDGENGVLLKEVSAATVAGGIRRLLSDPVLLKRAKDNNRRQAWERYGAGQVIPALETIYAEVSGRGHEAYG